MPKAVPALDESANDNNDISDGEVKPDTLVCPPSVPTRLALARVITQKRGIKPCRTEEIGTNRPLQCWTIGPSRTVSRYADLVLAEEWNRETTMKAFKKTFRVSWTDSSKITAAPI
ncbi:hypothetical protein PoB_007085900 [Plakobranchus ocellatus]|uniref:Uncharacterized protein n=1 Tax=Plakobranchus ocellatus TaxID=259542 RepID=A0AAV4DK10_9GAST|nr:hypothetical protein PoB_007085900 [Plakobranchus ocellatus]